MIKSAIASPAMQNVGAAAINTIAKPLYMPVGKKCRSLRNIHQSPSSRSSTHGALCYSFRPLRLGSPVSTPLLDGTITVGIGIPFLGVPAAMPPLC